MLIFLLNFNIQIKQLISNNLFLNGAKITLLVDFPQLYLVLVEQTLIQKFVTLLEVVTGWHLDVLEVLARGQGEVSQVYVLGFIKGQLVDILLRGCLLFE